VTIDFWIASAVETSSTRGRKASRLVQQAEALALANVDEPLHVSGLCHIIGVSERTLRKAFHRVHGIPPCRHLRMLRLSKARRALLSADGTLAKVTEIAMTFGFAELGRFSVEYKKAFGESPSQTLYRTP
jgi:transcriptional regulator GlxA family with amidase domain